MCKTSLLDVDTVRATDELGWESRRQLSLAVTFSLSRDIGTCGPGPAEGGGVARS